ncbi:MAG: 50S ribosomal protein L31e [Candidatus Thorarchaeota archaeon AB_25]|nr:MAG: 50S ribosomal protein L31e [Candidatus Thorarchaeota archaeon AB_25]
MSKKKKKEAKAEVSKKEPEIEEIEETEEIEEVEEAPADAEEVEAPAVEEEPEEEEEIIDERIYTVPLRKAYWTGSRLRRSNRAVRVLREFVERHMKPEELLIQPEVNERIWARGIQKPPRRVRIRATKNSDNLVRVYLAEG